MCTLVADGNFKQDHLAMRNDNDNVALSDGLGYMVGQKEFNMYMDSTPPTSKSRMVMFRPYQCLIQRLTFAFRLQQHQHAMSTVQSHNRIMHRHIWTLQELAVLLAEGMAVSTHTT